MAKRIIRPGFLQVLVEKKSKQGAGGLMLPNMNEDNLNGLVENHSEWKGDEVENLLLEDYPIKGDRVFLPKTGYQEIVEDGNRYVYVHIKDLRTWEKQ